VKLILTQDIEGVGEKNDVVDVTGGYGRNFLIPRGMAKVATKGALSELELVRRIDERRGARLREEAEKAAGKLATLVLRIPAKTGSSGRLFGSVTPQEIAERLHEETGLEVDRRKVELEAPIRSIGTYSVPVTIFTGVTRPISVEVFSDEVVEDEEPEEEPTVEETEAPADSAETETEAEGEFDETWPEAGPVIHPVEDLTA